MRKLTRSLLFLFIPFCLNSQNITSNRDPHGLEHNMLFNSNTRYKVTQTGNAKLNLNILFDGKFYPSYTSTAPSATSPTVILIEGVPNYHKQGGAWVGWSTRYWQPKRFKIEGYNSYNGANTWVTISDYTNQDYSGGTKHIKAVPFGSYTKFKFTIFSAYGENGKLGLSELFYIHPEAVRPYQGLLAEETWKKSVSSIYFSDGNVGIGTTLPKAKLNIIPSETIALNDLSKSSILIGKPSAGLGFDQNEIVNKGSDMNIGTLTEGKNIIFRAGGNVNRMVVKGGNGNVGIGTTNPTQRLDVNGSIVIDNKLHPYSKIQIGHDKNDMIISDNTTEKYYGGGYFFRVHNENIPHKYIDALTISTTGDIGINTLNTKGYKLAVAGKAITEEVVVKLQSTWPDYVFEKDYELPSLEEVEKHIKEKGHLENIPAAEEVEKNGLQLGEMNKKLLQKIEELTLYILQQEKRLKKQDEDIEKILKRVSTLEKK